MLCSWFRRLCRYKSHNSQYTAQGTSENERGQSLVLIALGFTALVVFIGLALDGAKAYDRRTKMQNAADAAAMAGAREVVIGSTESVVYNRISEYTVTRNEATSFSATYYTNSRTGNAITGTGSVPGGARGVCVTSKADFATLFVRIIGIGTLHIEANSCAATTGLCANGYAIWANSESCSSAINWTGGQWYVTGKVHSNDSIKDTGPNNTIDGTCEYVNSVGGSQLFNFIPSTGNPVQVVANPIYPVSYNIADYQPGGRAAVAAGANYYYKSGAYNFSSSDPDGLYYIAGSGTSHISSAGAGTRRFTIVTTGNLGWTAPLTAPSSVSPYIDGLFMYSTSGSGDCTSGTPAINFSASGVNFSGIIFAPGGYLQVSGSSNTGLQGSLIADSIRLSGTGVTLTYNPNLCDSLNVANIRLKLW